MNISALFNRSQTRKILLSVSFCLVITALAGCAPKTDAPQPEIAVANSYLNAVVKDLCGVDEDVMDLVPPGMCPGHFDIKPSQVSMLNNCKHLFLFNFQKNIEKAIPGIKENGLQVHIINPGPGLCIPDIYMDIASQVESVLSEANPLMQQHYQMRLQEIKTRHANLQSQLTQDIEQAGLNHCRVLTSQHQEKFVAWLGLDPVSTFTSQDTATPGSINENIQQAQNKQVAIIIANKQEGTEMASAIAEYLKINSAVFSNFPNVDNQDDSSYAFDNMLIDNVSRLVQAVR